MNAELVITPTEPTPEDILAGEALSAVEPPPGFGAIRRQTPAWKMLLGKVLRQSPLTRLAEMIAGKSEAAGFAVGPISLLLHVAALFLIAWLLLRRRKP